MSWWGEAIRTMFTVDAQLKSPIGNAPEYEAQARGDVEIGVRFVPQ